EMQQERSELIVAVAVAEHVVVVQYQDDWLRHAGQFTDQQRQQRPGKIRWLIPERGQDAVSADPGADALQRPDHMPPQPAGIVVTAIEGDPGEWARLGRAGLPLSD